MDQGTILNYIINHVFLPPKLPQSDDSSHDMSSILMERFIGAMKEFQSFLPQEDSARWSVCTECFQRTLELREQGGKFSGEKFGLALKQMASGGIM